MADRIATGHGGKIHAALVASKHEDFAAIYADGAGVSISVYPLTAADCMALADQLSNIAQRLRASEQDRARFLDALAADEMQEAA